MKNPLESPEVLEAYGRIDLSYFLIRKIYEKMPKSPLDRMIDKATGHDKSMTDDLIQLLKDIICKCFGTWVFKLVLVL